VAIQIFVDNIWSLPKPLNITDLDISYQKELVLPTISYLNAKQIIISVKGTVHPQIIII